MAIDDDTSRNSSQMDNEHTENRIKLISGRPSNTRIQLRQEIYNDGSQLLDMPRTPIQKNSSLKIANNQQVLSRSSMPGLTVGQLMNSNAQPEKKQTSLSIVGPLNIEDFTAHPVNNSSRADKMKIREQYKKKTEISKSCIIPNDFITSPQGGKQVATFRRTFNKAQTRRVD